MGHLKNTRTINVPTYNVSMEDDILNLDTSIGITLVFPNIRDSGCMYADKRWYINDATGGAAANPVTITAVSGIQINDASSQQLSTANFGASVFATNQEKYVITGSGGSGGTTIVTAPFVPTNTAIIVGDDFQEVAEKSQGQINDIVTNVTELQNNEYKITYFAEISAASGTITKPTGSTILLDQFAGGVDAYVSTITNGQPTGNFPETAGGVLVDVTSFDTSGNFVLSGTPSAYPCALIYIIKISAADYQNLTLANILDSESSFGKEDVSNKATDFSIINNTLYPSVEAVNNQIIESLPSNNIYVFSGTNSDILGYKSMPLLANYTTGALASTSQTVTTTPTLIEEFATPVGYPNVTAIPAGIITVHFETEKVAGSNNYYSYAEIYKRTSGGVETLLATTDSSSETSVNTRVQITISAFLSNISYLNSTDRIVIKVYCVMLSSSATIGVYYDDNTDARMQLPTTSVDLSAYALLNSPSFIGTPTAPTQSVNDNTTKLATTAFVQSQIAASAAISNRLFNYYNFL